MRLVFVSIPTYIRKVPTLEAPARRARRNAETLIFRSAGLYVNSVATRSLCRGLWALATACRNAGHEITWVDAGDRLLATPETKARLAGALERADQLWLYAMTPTEHLCLAIAREAKRVNPRITVLLGGPHASARFREILAESPEVDVVATGFESSGALAAHCEHPEDMPNVATRAPDHGTRSSPRWNLPLTLPGHPASRADDLGTASPVGRRAHADGSLRVTPGQAGGDYIETVAPDILERPMRDYHINVSSTVGCSFSCNFCVDGRANLRSRALEDLKHELSYYDRTLAPGTVVHFFDTVFGLPREHFDAVADFVSSSIHDIVFSCDVKSNVVTEELAARFARARVKFVSMGVESSVEPVLRLTRKRQHLSGCVTAARTLRRHLPGAILKAYWILGLPGTTPERAREDLEAAQMLLREGLFDVVSPKFFVPYPGTAYFDAPESHGLSLTNRDFRDYDRFHTPPVCHPDTMSPEDLTRLLASYEQVLAESYAHRLGMTVAALRNDDCANPRYNGPLYDAGSVRPG